MSTPAETIEAVMSLLAPHTDEHVNAVDLVEHLLHEKLESDVLRTRAETAEAKLAVLEQQCEALINTGNEGMALLEREKLDAIERAEKAEKDLAQMENFRDRAVRARMEVIGERDTLRRQLEEARAAAVWKDDAINHVLAAIDDGEDIDTAKLRAALTPPEPKPDLLDMPVSALCCGRCGRMTHTDDACPEPKPEQPKCSVCGGPLREGHTFTAGPNKCDRCACIVPLAMSRCELWALVSPPAQASREGMSPCDDCFAHGHRITKMLNGDTCGWCGVGSGLHNAGCPNTSGWNANGTEVES